jgi:hypothetical protein
MSFQVHHKGGVILTSHENDANNRCRITLGHGSACWYRLPEPLSIMGTSVGMEILASLVLAIHFVWISWVALGALWTRGRVLLAASHILSLVWGILVELLPWPLSFDDRRTVP